MSTIQEVLKTEWISCPRTGHNGCNVRKMADFGAILILVAFLLQCFDIFCCFDLVENSQILGVKTGKTTRETSKSHDFEVFWWR